MDHSCLLLLYWSLLLGFVDTETFDPNNQNVNSVDKTGKTFHSEHTWHVLTDRLASSTASVNLSIKPRLARTDGSVDANWPRKTPNSFVRMNPSGKTVHVETKLCNLTVDNNTFWQMEHFFKAYFANFVRFTIKFNFNTTSSERLSIINQTPGVIRPYDWVWTYYTPKRFFPYLKWPTDFNTLSFGLLDSKTLSSRLKTYVQLNVHDSNCTLTLGDHDTTKAIGNALKDLAQIFKTDRSSYFCYQSEVPSIKNTLEYRLGIYLGFPVEFARYNCCRVDTKQFTNIPISRCLDQIPKMWQVIKLPYIIGVFAFAYFPIILMSASGILLSMSRKFQSQSRFILPRIVDDGYSEIRREDLADIIYLDGEPPISIYKFVGGLCCLVDKYPHAVSRIRRGIFVLLIGPSIIFIEVYLYYQTQLEMTLAYLQHGYPMGYLSLIGGYDKSKNNFLPVLGGPYALLFGFFLAGIVFVILPSRPDMIIHEGTQRHTPFGKVSPIFFDIETIESLAPYSISNVMGYSRVAILTRSMFYMIMNPKFWIKAITMQCRRYIPRHSTSVVSVILRIAISPLYIIVCLIELMLCVLVYGIPIVNILFVVVTGYIVTLLRFLRRPSADPSVASCLLDNVLVKTFFAIITAVLFAYYICSFCTIFLCSFAFIGSIIVFSFLAVLVYPSTSFGYLFFGIVFIYYIFKVFQNFGNGYIELLADAVDISSHLEMDLDRINLIDGTVIIDTNRGPDITKLQVRDHVINLSTAQRQEIRQAFQTTQKKLVYTDHEAGIPRDLFFRIVKEHRPVYKYVTQATLKIISILALLGITVSIIGSRTFGSDEGISEVMHVVFIIGIGALPRVMEVAMDNMNHTIKKDIQMRKVKTTIIKYWVERND